MRLTAIQTGPHRLADLVKRTHLGPLRGIPATDKLGLIQPTPFLGDARPAE